MLRLLPAFLSVAAALQPPLPQAAPAAPAGPAAQSHWANDLGFSYHLPEDWQIEIQEPREQRQAEKPAPEAEEKTGIACTEVPMTARHGEPATVIVIVALPFACYGQSMTAEELPGFAAGAADGLKQVFTVSLPITATYTLAGHRMWVERARAVAVGKTAPAYTLEIACTILKKSAVCWLAQAADEAGLRIFENAPVTLDGDAAPALVPSEVFLHHR